MKIDLQTIDMITCAYYRMKFGGSLWAMRVHVTAFGATILEAVGPLAHGQTHVAPMEHHSPRVDVKDWAIQAFEQVGGTWALRAKHRFQTGQSEAPKPELDRFREGFATHLLSELTK